MNIVEVAHGKQVLKRRFNVLSNHVAKLIPKQSSVLDIGCGSGEIDQLILQQRSDITIDGVDVLVREDTAIQVTAFDGNTLPYEDNSYDVAIFVDVLHHTDNIERLLGEAVRVARKCVIIKDHTRHGFLSGMRLNFMDRVGNRRFGVSLPYNYYTKSEWLQAFEEVGMGIDIWETKLHLYPWPFSLVFDASLHFVARLMTNETKVKKECI